MIGKKNPTVLAVLQSDGTNEHVLSRDGAGPNWTIKKTTGAEQKPFPHQPPTLRRLKIESNELVLTINHVTEWSSERR